ncbi:MAG: restriction endonuclease subunit S [Candidatus Thermoplasmatota archaeon]|nr:restriction endonuclease subunit S [Candidatus Thermoplasmatota archaeon]
MTRPGYKLTEIGEIPEDWNVVELGSMIEILDLMRVPLSETERERKKGSIPYCGANGIIDYINDYLFEEEAVLIAEDGGNYGKYQNKAYVMSGKYWVNNHAHIFRGKYGLLDNRFIMQWLNFAEISPYVSGSTRTKLNQEMLKSIIVPKIPFLEQQKISEILSTADETIQKVNEEITMTEKLKKGLMQTLLTKGIAHTKFKRTEIGEIPDPWNVKELYQVSELRKETIEPMKYMSEHYVGLENISPGQLRIFSYGDATNLKSSKFKFKKGDILYGKLRPYLDKVALAEFDGVCSTDIIPIVSKNLNARFLAYMLHSDLFLQFVKSTVSGTNHPRTAWKQMSHFLVPFPSISEQQKIAEILSTVDNKLELLRNKKGHLEKLKKGLMGDLLTGKVRVKIDTSIGEN